MGREGPQLLLAHHGLLLTPCALAPPWTPRGQVRHGDLRGKLQGEAWGPAQPAGYSHTMLGRGALSGPCSGASAELHLLFFPLPGSNSPNSQRSPGTAACA